MAQDLNDLLSQLTSNTGGTDVSSAFLQDTSFEVQKSKLKQQMAGLANTQTGIDVLKQLTNNTSITELERIAAAETLNPGTSISMDQNGAFIINAPQANVQYDPQRPETTPAGTFTAQKIEQQNNTAQRAVSSTVLLDNINQRFDAIQASTDLTSSVDQLAQLNQTVNDYKAARGEELRAQSRKLFGIDALEQQVETDRQLDMEESQQMYGVDYLGPSESSQLTITQLQQNSAKATEWLQRQVSMDPALVAIDTKTKAINEIAQSRFRELGQQQAVSEIAALTSTKEIDAALIALGTDPLAATPAQRNQVAIGVQSDASTRQRANIGLASTPVLNQFIDAGGIEAESARNVMISRAGGDTAQVDAIIKAYQNFDDPSVSGLTPEQLQKQGLAMPGTAQVAGGEQENVLAQLNQAKGTELKNQQLAVKQARWNYVLQSYNKQATNEMYLMEGFDEPQASELSDWNATLSGLRSAQQSINPDKPVILQEVISSLNWPEDKQQAQRKQEALADFLMNQAGKKGNTLTGLPNQFGNRNLILAYIQTARIDGMVGRNIREQKAMQSLPGNIGVGLRFGISNTGTM